MGDIPTLRVEWEERDDSARLRRLADRALRLNSGGRDLFQIRRRTPAKPSCSNPGDHLRGLGRRDTNLQLRESHRAARTVQRRVVCDSPRLIAASAEASVLVLLHHEVHQAPGHGDDLHDRLPSSARDLRRRPGRGFDGRRVGAGGDDDLAAPCRVIDTRISISCVLHQVPRRTSATARRRASAVPELLATAPRPCARQGDEQQHEAIEGGPRSAFRAW